MNIQSSKTSECLQVTFDIFDLPFFILLHVSLMAAHIF